MKRLNPKAVLIALAVTLALDIAGSLVLTILLSVHSSQDRVSRQTTTETLDAVTHSDGYLVGELVYGTITTVVGGYLAARLARNYPYFNAAALGLVGVALGLLQAGGSPLWFNAISFLVVLPAAVYGGHLSKRRALANTP